MRKVCTNQSGFGVHELIIVLLVVGAVFGVGGYVWSKNSTHHSTGSTRTSTITPKEADSSPQTTTPDPYEGWRMYDNAELGFKFRYPQEWGTPSVVRKALNNEKYETNLPYLVKFSNTEAPQARIFSADWKFNPPFATEWNKPLTREFLLGEGALQVTQDQAKVASIYFSPIGGGIPLLGVKSEVIPKLNSSQVEFMQGEAYADGGRLAPKTTCLTQKTDGSMQGYPTLDCYPEAYRNNFVKFMDSFTAI